MTRRYKHCSLALLITAMAALAGCEQKPAESAQAALPQAAAPQTSYEPVTVRHQLGTVVIEERPQRVVALDMNEVDFLDRLGVPVAGMPKDFVPHFLAPYKEDPQVQDMGAIVQPNLERVHAARPDLILITSLQANHYQALSEIAPTIQFDVDYRDSHANHIAVVKEHLMTLGHIFGKRDSASSQAATLEMQAEEARRVTQDRLEKALIVLHDNGAFSSFGVQSRYGFVFNALGVKPASTAVETSLHGEPISSEFIHQADPDILYVVDRTAVMEHRPSLNARTLGNPLLRATRAWKNDRVVFVDAEAWYVMAASPTSLAIVIDDVLKAYRN